jgi:hypothetical protein
MCLPVQAVLTSAEVSGAAFKLYACYCAHREGFEANVKAEQIHAETGIGLAYISTLKFELLKAGWIGLSKLTAKGIVPLKGFEVAVEHIRSERKLSKIERTSDKDVSNIERKVVKVSKSESSKPAPEKLSKIKDSLSDVVSKNERNQTESFENQKEIPGTPIAPSKAKNTSTEKNSQPSVEADANAPPPPKSKKVRASTADPRSKHAAIQIVRTALGHYPKIILYEKIIGLLGDHPDGKRVIACATEWATRGGNSENLNTWLFNWYTNGIPDKALNGDVKPYAATNGHRNGKPSLTDRAAEYADYYGGESPEEHARQNHR